jgi:hypothetical protein
MLRMIRLSAAISMAFTLYALAPLSIGAAPAAAAVVYCKTAGVPKGCVARPTAVAVYCTAPGVPLGCVARPVKRVVVAPVVVAPVVVAPIAPRHYGAPGYPGNRGGPVNRVGRR